MPQGYYRGMGPQKVRAIDPVVFINHDPSVQATIGTRGQIAVYCGNALIPQAWQKQDYGITTNWIPFGSSGTVSTENVVLKNLNCEASVNTLDILRFDGSLLKSVTNANQISKGVAGVCISKASPLVCDLLILGKISGFVGLTPGAALFLGQLGGFSNLPPTSGFIQFLGFAIDSNNILFSPKLAIGL